MRASKYIDVVKAHCLGLEGLVGLAQLTRAQQLKVLLI